MSGNESSHILSKPRSHEKCGKIAAKNLFTNTLQKKWVNDRHIGNCIQVPPSFYWKLSWSSVIWRNIYSLKLVEITRAPFCSSHIQGGEWGVSRAGNKKVDLVSLCSRKGNMKPNENCNPSCPARGKLLRLNPCDYHSLSQTPVVIIRHWIKESVTIISLKSFNILLKITWHHLWTIQTND